MFVGHYGVSYAVKAVHKSIPLWVLFLAVQIVDVFWAVFVLLGIEHVRIVPGITATNPLDLYYMPYTHSLVASLIWAGAALVAYKAFPKLASSWGAAALVGVAVFSHWALDLLVHRPDLPLIDNAYKVGLGIWNFPIVAFVLEAGLLLAGILLYQRVTKATAPIGKYGMLVFGAALLGVQAFVFSGSPPASPAAAAVTALVAYGALTAIAFWLERKRA